MTHTDKNTVSDFLLNPRFRMVRHMLLQLLIISITINVSLDGQAKLSANVTNTLSWLGYFTLINSSIYFNLYVLAPRYLEKERYNTYLLGIAGLVTFTLMGISVLQALLYDFRGIKELKEAYLIIINLISSTLSISLMIAGTSTLLLLRHWVGHNERIGELEATTLQSELKHLKRQINPHFLFNMLNNANVLVKKNPEDASQLLFKLEDLLRYQINDSSKDNVALSSDIHFLNDFLNLEKIRRDKFEYTITTEGEVDNVFLPPLLFIPFVENAVKHNFDSNHESFVHISFKVRGKELKFECTNSKPAEMLSDSGQAGGLGLKNIKRRLELLFPDSHSLGMEDHKLSYNVNLHLTL